MKIETLPVDTLIPYARNSRTHSAEQISQIAASIRAFGFNNPVLIDDDDGIIAGHGRVMAAHKLKMDEVPCVRLSHLSERDKRAYVIADNKLALNAGWDETVLAAEMQALHSMDFDLDLLGFGDDELEALLGHETAQADSPAPAPDPGINYQEKYAVLVDCKDEADQRRIFERLTAEGLACKVLVN